MLALARCEGQSIIIDGRIEVKIVKWSRSSVRLAIQAPREVTVDRDEIWRKMHPGQLSPLEKAEQERRERFAREQGLSVEEASLFPVKSPFAGKILLQPSTPAPFVSVGSAVEPGALLALVEAVPSPREIHTHIRGTIAKILVTHGQIIEHDQPLFLIKPSP